MARRPDPRQLDLFAVLDFRTEPAHDTGPVEAGRTPMDRALIEAGLGCFYSLSMGYALQDLSVPYTPRSIAFPVTLHRERDGTPHLLVASPAYADLSYVRRVEAVTGLRAVSDPRASGAIWDHAVDLANDAGWERLAATMEFTDLDCVDQAVGMNVIGGQLSSANARALMERLGVEEPSDRSADALAEIDVNLHGFRVDETAWVAIHAVEDGWVKPGREGKSRTVCAALTKKALDRIASRQQQAA